jgi:uncharacterized protein YjlB
MPYHPASPHSAIVVPSEVMALRIEEDGSFPNNEWLPVIVYKSALRVPDTGDPAMPFERVFATNGWTNGWRDDLYGYHHYHSTAHEVLGCYAGRACLQLGGPNGPEIDIESGDVLVLPAGVSHKKINASDDFAVVGCYAGGRRYDMMYGHYDERPTADERILRIPPPDADPIYGSEGPLARHWNLPKPHPERDFRM